MITVLLVMIAGIIAGVFIHQKPKLIKLNDRLISLAIYLLLFLLGISVGLNKTIIQNIGTLGFSGADYYTGCDLRERFDVVADLACFLQIRTN